MILFINTADVSKVYLALVNQGKIVHDWEFAAQYQQAEKLLPAIDRMLRKNKIKLKNLRAIGAVTGPGPFTALRIGITVANTLAWSQAILVFGIKLSEFEKAPDLAKLIQCRAQKAKAGALLEPFYGQEPNITLKKK